MSWRRKSSKSGLLYLILDKAVIDQVGGDIFSLADKSAYYGVDLLQLRVKGIDDNQHLDLAKRLTKIIHRRGKLFIVNDRVDIAYLSEAAGLHLGSDDIGANYARKILGASPIIGQTIHNLNQLKSSHGQKIDYISIGPAFKTETKPDLVPIRNNQMAAMIAKAKKLMFAIGGINLYNIETLLNYGIKNLAVCRDILLAKDLKTTISKYKQCLKRVS